MAQPASPPASETRHPHGWLAPLEAMDRQAARDRMALAMENAALCRQVRELGGVPVSRSTDEWVALYESCARVVRAAGDLVAFLGTSKEMLEEFS